MSLVEEFAKGPRSFLSKYVIVIDEAREGVPFPKVGIHRFTLTAAIKNLIYLEPDDGKGGPSMRAHWLPWISKGVSTYQLTDEAPLFFTSQLTGCRMTCLPDKGDPKRALIAHLAGDMRRGVVDRNAWEKQNMKDPNANKVDSRARRLSFSDPTSYKGNTACVIGFITPSGWKFVAQTFKSTDSGDQVIVDPMLPILR